MLREQAPPRRVMNLGAAFLRVEVCRQWQEAKVKHLEPSRDTISVLGMAKGSVPMQDYAATEAGLCITKQAQAWVALGVTEYQTWLSEGKRDENDHALVLGELNIKQTIMADDTSTVKASHCVYYKKPDKSKGLVIMDELTFKYRELKEFALPALTATTTTTTPAPNPPEKQPAVDKKTPDGS